MLQVKFLPLKKHTLYYTQPIRVIDQITNYQSIDLITFTYQDKLYHGEINLLPQIHKTTSQEIHNIYNEFFSHKTFSLDLNSTQLETPFFNLFSLNQRLPAPLLYAIEQALLALLIQLKKIENLHSDIQSAYLITNKTPPITTSCYKIKIRPGHSLPINLPTKCNLRLDGNEMFTPQQLKALLANIQTSLIEFIEDPYSNIEDYLTSPIAHPVAFDMQLTTAIEKKLPFQYAIIKPSSYGISHSINLINQLTKQNKKIIISSSYEGEVAKQALIYLATYANNQQPSVQHGLSPLSWLHPLSSLTPYWKDLLSLTHSPFWNSLFTNAINLQQQWQQETMPKVALVATPSPLFLENLIALWMNKTHVLLLDHKLPSKERELICQELNFKLSSLKTKKPLQQVTLNPTIDIQKPLLTLMTSGSSGKRKGVTYSLNQLCTSAFSSIFFYKMQSNHHFIQSLPFHHIGGMMIFCRAMMLNAHYTLTDWTNISLRQHLTEHIDYISLVPLQLSKLLSDSTAVKTLQKSKAIILGGSKISSSLLNTSKKLKLPLSLSYGMSETTAQVTATSPGSLDSGSGLPLLGCDIKITAQKLITIKSDRLALGYYTSQGLKPFHLVDRYFITNDLGIMHKKLLTVLGRADNVYISGGENLSAEMIEEMILRHPQIEEVLIVPVPDKQLGEVGFLFYQSVGDIDLKNFKLFLKQTLHRFAHPHYLYPYNFDQYFKPPRKELSKFAQQLIQQKDQQLVSL